MPQVGVPKVNMNMMVMVMAVMNVVRTMTTRPTWSTAPPASVSYAAAARERQLGRHKGAYCQHQQERKKDSVSYYSFDHLDSLLDVSDIPKNRLSGYSALHLCEWQEFDLSCAVRRLEFK
jgi:hypothetical protein